MGIPGMPGMQGLPNLTAMGGQNPFMMGMGMMPQMMNNPLLTQLLQ